MQKIIEATGGLILLALFLGGIYLVASFFGSAPSPRDYEGTGYCTVGGDCY